MMMRLILLHPNALIVGTLLVLATAAAFVVVPSSSLQQNHRQQKRMTFQRNSKTTRLYYYSIPNDELERVRASLEAIVAHQKEEAAFVEAGLMEHAQAQDMLLTSSGRRLRELEMQLLYSLLDTDDAVEELIHLWTTEGNAHAAADLLQMNEKCSDGLVEEEERLLVMIAEFPNWAEPFSRLATVYYFKGQYEPAMRLAARALELKPWHFEATQLFVELSRHVDDSIIASIAKNENAEDWKNRTLPPLDNDNKERRVNWVNRALDEAMQRYQQADQVTTSIQRGEQPKNLVSRQGNAWQ